MSVPTGNVGDVSQDDRQAGFKRTKLELDTTKSPDPISNLSNEGLAAEVERLAQEIEKGQDFLHYALSELPDSEQWHQLRRDLEDTLNGMPDTSCKVVALGTSGVGKSTVLNALLDDIVLPSSGIGEACTAVPIEVHYNHDASIGNVKADIQYITADAWRDTVMQGKVEIGYDEIEMGDNRQGALQALQTVYPNLTTRDLVEMPVDQIMLSNESKALLGKCIKLESADRSDFDRTFRQTIGSKKKHGHATWPLIDHVRLYVRHELLEYGLVLVDVPGVFDLNLARVQKTNTYLSKCSAVCIMTHAARGGSDAVQRSLVERVLNQVQYDGRLDNVMLVCTKSDDVDIKEVITEFDDHEVRQLRSRMRAATDKLQELQKQIGDWKDELENETQTADFKTKDIQRWTKAQAKASGDWDSFRQPAERLAGGGFLKVEENDRIWDQDAVAEQMRTLKSERVTAMSRCKQIKASLKTKEREVAPAKQMREKLTLDIKRRTFRARNDYLRNLQAKMCQNVIRQYEKLSMESERSATEGVDIKATDFDEIVEIESRCFCVSALAYSQLVGLKDRVHNSSEGMVEDSEPGTTGVATNVDDTEIPALSRKIKQVALRERYHKLSNIMEKLQLWIGSIKGQLSTTIREQDIDIEAAEQANLKFASNVTKFVQEFEKVLTTDTSAKTAFQEHFSDKMITPKKWSLAEAVKRLLPYAKQPMMGGSKKALYPAEYKAAVHPGRKGFYVGTRTLDDGTSLYVNFNDTIAAVIKCSTHRLIKRLKSNRGKIKQTFLQLEHTLTMILNDLHQHFRFHSITAGVTIQMISLADEQFERRRRDLDQTFRNLCQSINDIHVDQGTQIAEDVKRRLIAGYDRAYQQSGAGARAAMSDTLTQALDKDNVIGGALKALDTGMSSEFDKLVAQLVKDLGEMAKSIAAEYSGYMQEKGQKIKSIGDPKLDRIRNRMIALGYDSMGMDAVKYEPQNASMVKTEQIEDFDDAMDQVEVAKGHQFAEQLDKTTSAEDY